MAVMQVDLSAGSRYRALPTSVAESMARRPTILVFDSGLGGLTVFAEVARARPDAAFVYAADDAGFPYGRRGEADLVARVNGVMDRLVEQYRPDAVVVACNTASTLVLPHLRARFPAVPFVGTVPAIKPAAASSRSRQISVLATPGTVARDYTRALIEAYAGGCAVTLVGSVTLAELAESLHEGRPCCGRERSPTNSSLASSPARMDGGPTASSSPARTTPFTARASRHWRPGPSPGSIRRRRLRGGSIMCWRNAAAC